MIGGDFLKNPFRKETSHYPYCKNHTYIRKEHWTQNIKMAAMDLIAGLVRYVIQSRQVVLYCFYNVVSKVAPKP